MPWHSCQAKNPTLALGHIPNFVHLKQHPSPSNASRCHVPKATHRSHRRQVWGLHWGEHTWALTWGMGQKPSNLSLPTDPRQEQCGWEQRR